MTDPITCTCGHTQADHWHSAGCLRCPCGAAPETVEIEALRAQLKSLQAHDASINVQLTIERDRLRKALEKINIFGWPEKYINDTEQIVYELVDIARAALEKTK